MGTPVASLSRLAAVCLFATLAFSIGTATVAESPIIESSGTELPPPGTALEASSRAALPLLRDDRIEGDPSIHPGFPVFLDPPTNSQPYTPTLYDIDTDGADEIFVTGQHTFGIRGDGSFLPGWPTTEQELAGYGTNANLPGPSAADFEPGGDREVLWTTRDWWAGNSRLWSFNARRANGSDLPGFPQEAPDSPSNALWTPFVLGDSDHDGDLEAWGAHTLGNNSVQNRISALDQLGNLLFTIELEATESVKSLHFGDLDGNGQKEMFAVSEFGTQVRLHVFDDDGNSAAGYPINLPDASSGWLAEGPAVPVDLDHDRDLELVLVNYDPTSFVQCVHHDGSSCAGFPFTVAPDSQPLNYSLGDINRDSQPELVLSQVDLDTGDSNIFVLDLERATIVSGWPVVLPDLPRGLPVVADVTGDHIEDILVVTTSGSMFAVRGNGSVISDYPKVMTSNSISGAAVGDIDADGLLEIVAATWDGWIYAWDTNGHAAEKPSQWRMRGVNARNTGVYGDLDDLLFRGGFESGQTSAWTNTVP